MTTSGTFSFSVNRDQIFRMAALNIGRLEENENLSAQETADINVFFNMMVKQWMGKSDFAPGLKAFTRKRGHLLTSGLTGSYALGPTAQGWTNSIVQTSLASYTSSGSAIPAQSVTGMTAGDTIALELDANYYYYSTITSFTGNTINISGTVPSQASSGSAIFTYTTPAQIPVAISAAYLRDSYGNDSPLNLLTSDQWDLLPNKMMPTNISDCIGVYWDNQSPVPYIRTDCYAASDFTKHIVLTYLEPTMDYNNPSDTIEFPQEWYMALALNLSRIISPMFTVNWTQTMEANALMALRIAQGKDVERETMYFQPGQD